jgi:hypothetical protein
MNATPAPITQTGQALSCFQVRVCSEAMPRAPKPVSLYPLSVEDVIAALVRIPRPRKQ